MKNAKKTVLLITGPGVLFVLAVALFVHLFTGADAKVWIIGGMVVFFVVFIPLYAYEYFKQEFTTDTEKKVHFKRKRGRTNWHGGNIHGKVPIESEKPGRLFKD